MKLLLFCSAVEAQRTRGSPTCARLATQSRRLSSERTASLPLGTIISAGISASVSLPVFSICTASSTVRAPAGVGLEKVLLIESCVYLIRDVGSVKIVLESVVGGASASQWRAVVTAVPPADVVPSLALIRVQLRFEALSFAQPYSGSVRLTSTDSPLGSLSLKPVIPVPLRTTASTARSLSSLWRAANLPM